MDGQITPDSKTAEPVADGELEATQDDSAAPRPMHWLRGGLTAVIGGFVPFCTMASEHRWRLSVPVGFVGCLVATWGILDLVGTFDDRGVVATRTASKSLWPRLSELFASVIAHVMALALAVAGILPAPRLSAAILVTSTFLWAVIALFRTAEVLGAWRDAQGGQRPLLRRHGFWLVVLITLLYLPMLGNYSLSDPWETHYGEVSRELLSRDDWISTWWAQDGWFWSKPVLDFWIQGLAFSVLGVHYLPDQMLRGAEKGLFPQPEWAARMPVFLITLVGAYCLYRAVAKIWGARAGFLAGLVLTTMPYWYLLAHQTMTDMPYVGTLTAGMALLISGLHTDQEDTVQVYELTIGRRTVKLTAFHLVFGAVLLCAIPQILYIATRNVTLHLSNDLFGFRFHPDEFESGSTGNCGLPGNEACNAAKATSPGFWPLHGAALWALTLGILIWTNREERRTQRLYFIAAWFFIALAALGKGAPGLVVPVAAVAAYVLAARRWRDLERLELSSLVLLIACVTLPWYVQMFARHGAPFIDRLIMHDMYKRAFEHVHDTNQGEDVSFRYYIWQLGYGLFPWTGLSIAGLVWWIRHGDRDNPRADASTLLMMWILASFGMFTITLTKFHHYIFPLVPAVAVLLAVVLDRAYVGTRSPAAPDRSVQYFATLFAGAALVVYGIFRLFPRKLDGTAFASEPTKAWGVVAILLGLIALTHAIRRYGRHTDEIAAANAAQSITGRYETWSLAGVGVISALSVGLAGRDLVASPAGDVTGQIRLMHLFTYNYSRPWPNSLDFTGALVAFTVMSVAASLLFCLRRFRPHAATILCATAILWTAWGLDVYLVKASPHWGQRETIFEYYKRRASPDEPIVAYQMNWKGENFYTGNHVPAFVSSGQKFKDWLTAQKEKGVRAIYITTEHGRMGTLKREVGDVKSFERLTDETLNNKFFLARVVL